MRFKLVIVSLRWINPPLNYYQASEWWRLGSFDRDWVAIEEIAPVMARAVVAAEDANFCRHWGVDLDAVRDVIESGSARGASTISQQVAKNVFLWHQRSFLRKGLEAGFTVEHHFGVSAKDINLAQASRLAAVLPDPKGRSASKPSPFVVKRAKGISSGAQTILADGRAACFEGDQNAL